MKVLVTGATGFIGSKLVRDLVELGADVSILVRPSSADAIQKKDGNLAGLNFRVVSGDLGDLSSLKQAVAGVDRVFHLAGLVTAIDTADFYRCNTQGTKNLIEAIGAVNPNLERFVFVSSLAAGGPMKLRQERVEGDTDAPVSEYGKSKKAAEVEVLKWVDRVSTAIIRPPMVYGPRDKASFVLIKTVAGGWMPMVAGASPDKKKYYSSIHVDDLCQGILKAGMADSNKFRSGDHFYLSSNQYVSYEDFLGSMAKALDVSSRKIVVPALALKAAAVVTSKMMQITGKSHPLTKDKLSEILPDYWLCSNQKAKTHFGFEPQFEVEQGMKITVRWYQENGWLKAKHLKKN